MKSENTGLVLSCHPCLHVRLLAMMLHFTLSELVDFVSAIEVKASAWYHIQHYHQEVA
jgi:hypothetical protein